MPLGRKLAIGSEEARRQRAELRISYGNKLSNMNLDRLRKQTQTQTQTHPHVEVSPMLSQSQAMGTASLRRIASSFAQVSDVNCGSYAALPLEDCEDDVREELNEVLIRSEPFHLISAKKPPAHIPVPVAVPVAKELPVIHREQRNTCCSDADRLKSRACERWNQIAGTVSSLFRVRRYEHAHPLAELRRLREQRDLLENFTRPFLYENTK
ncbi:uncharacterized protein LOC133847716 [Drosophila sulfurigaster albostrigata]|uniref:uncharacterized protein LOC133847716 n=1 Tax=Drosophila sulfurigaster albostrigata TaxID=89887 RepID=UPI002D21BA78|nr:uncharacterized protein LOC133847716 [Drosophila sulfurigaster albostrigata]